jgi:hypothetical protein
MTTYNYYAILENVITGRYRIDSGLNVPLVSEPGKRFGDSGITTIMKPLWEITKEIPPNKLLEESFTYLGKVTTIPQFLDSYEDHYKNGAHSVSPMLLAPWEEPSYQDTYKRIIELVRKAVDEARELVKTTGSPTSKVTHGEGIPAANDGQTPEQPSH